VIFVEGESVAPFLGNTEPILEAISGFVGEGEGEAADSAGAVGQGGFQTILFTDLESSTALTQRLGDEGAQELLRGHNTTVRGALAEHGGREVKHTGDGIMASFPSAVGAVTGALQIQREMSGGEVRVRIGLNAGEPIAEDDDLFGTAVQLAARICDRAEPGQVLVSRVVADLCAGKGLEFASAGEATHKGFDEPVALFEVTSA
jgi:class 3 adenylate cyclase